MAPYIPPRLNIHSTFDSAREFFESPDGSIFDIDQPAEMEAVLEGKRDFIAGEPGVGKSELLGKIQALLEAKDVATKLIGLRRFDAAKEIDSFLRSTPEPRALLLDALDEVKASYFPDVLDKIEQISRDNPNLTIFISSRWVFATRYAKSFSGYRFVTISPFSLRQVRDYLQQCGRTEADIHVLLDRVLSFSHRQLVVQIPRYLVYLNAYIEEKGVTSAVQLSRNELFEYFVYRKLEVEDEKMSSDKRNIIKRVLEKLALVMEIYQTNVISKDELMTFFDDLKSDLKRAALSQVGIEVFYGYSLLKEGSIDLENVEFENTEFQEYLAAKEITRFPDPTRTAFEFATDQNISEIYPSWYNALTFLVDMQPSLLEQLVEFSGLRAGASRVMDESFLVFLSRIDPRSLPAELRHQLFKDIVAYHDRVLHWLPAQLARALPEFFDASLEPYLKERVAAAEAIGGTARYVQLGNLSFLIAFLLHKAIPLDRPYWRAQLLKYAADVNDNGVLQRHALLGLRWLKDATIVEQLPDLFGADTLIMREFLSVYAEVAPDHPKSLALAIKATKAGEIHGRYSLYALKSPEAVKRFLRAAIDDQEFLREFLDDGSVFKDRDLNLVEKIAGTLDPEMRKLSEEFLVRAADHTVAHTPEESSFLIGLWKLLRKGNSGFFNEIIARIRGAKGGGGNLFFLAGLLAQVIEKEDLESFVRGMIADGEPWSAYAVFARVKHLKRADAAEIYDAGRKLLPKEYDDAEIGRRRSKTADEKRKKELLKEVRTLLRLESGLWGDTVFEFLNHHADELEPLLTDEDRDRIRILISGTVFPFMDPGKQGLTIVSRNGGSKSYSMDRSVQIFGDALHAARRLGFDIMPYRQQILNYIPFAYSEDLTTIFDLIKTVNPGEMATVIETYRARKTDLWQHNPESFVQAVERYRIVEAAPVLRELAREEAWENYPRRLAIVFPEIR